MKIINILLQHAVLITSAALFLTFGPPRADAQVMPSIKVAVISADKFSDPKIGIARIRKALTTLDKEFTPLQTELNQMASRLQQIQSELKNPSLDQAAKSKKYDEAEKLDRQIKFKQEDAKSLFERRQRVLMDPLFEAVMTALEAYAKTRGIDMIIDMSKTGNILLVNGALDISEAFIADYNTKYPSAQ